MKNARQTADHVLPAADRGHTHMYIQYTHGERMRGRGERERERRLHQAAQTRWPVDPARAGAGIFSVNFRLSECQRLTDPGKRRPSYPVWRRCFARILTLALADPVHSFLQGAREARKPLSGLVLPLVLGQQTSAYVRRTPYTPYSVHTSTAHFDSGFRFQAMLIAHNTRLESEISRHRTYRRLLMSAPSLSIT